MRINDLLNPARAHISRIGSVLDQAIWVEVCSECGRRGAWVCEFCEPLVQPYGPPGCARCGVAEGADCECQDLPAEIERIQAAYPFRGWIRSSIHRFKFKGEFARSPFLATLTFRRLDLSGIDLLVPVPIHRDRRHERGFNQAELLARDIGAQSGIPVDAAILTRPIKRNPQVGRSRDQRWFAVSGVFSVVNPAVINGKRIAIVDDVITTGATVSECAIVLAQAGAASVSAISVARG